MNQWNIILAFSGLLWTSSLGGQSAEPGKEANRDLATRYRTSVEVVYGEVIRMVPESNFRTGVMGVDLRSVKGRELPLEEIVWPRAKAYSLAVEARFKGLESDSLSAYTVEADEEVWAQVSNEAGDVFLARPPISDPLVAKLKPGDRGLFFIRPYLGSEIPLIDHVSFGQRASQESEVLQTFLAADGVPLAIIEKQLETRRRSLALEEAEAVVAFEDDYYRILRLEDLEIRRSLLQDLMLRMGYEKRWRFFEFKERYLKQHGSYLENTDAVPSSPPDGREKLWKDVSEQLDKIDLVLEARSRSP